MKQAMTGKVLDLVQANQPVAGCTISQQLYQETGTAIFVFSLAAQTSISAESYQNYKLLTVQSGTATIMGHLQQVLTAGESIILPRNVPVGVATTHGCIYTEIGLMAGSRLNAQLTPGQAFKVPNLVPYQAGKIINMDLVVHPQMKFVVMSFDAGTGLPEHAAPGDAMIFALAGAGVIRYEGTNHPIKAGESFKLAKGAHHAVTATACFKMALFVMLG